MADIQDVALDWDLTEADPDDGDHGWTVLEDGFYPFTVKKIERERFVGSQKMPACPMAKITLSVQGAAGETATVTERLFLTQRMLWKVSRFMESIGRGRNAAGKVIIDWVGAEDGAGWLKLKKRSYTTRDGDQRETNDVEMFCKPEEQEKAWREYSRACGDGAGAAATNPASPAAASAPTAPLPVPSTTQQPYAAQAAPAVPVQRPAAPAQPAAPAGWGIQ